jgi:rubrerythrin
MVPLPSGFTSDLIAAFGVLKTRTALSVDDLRVLAMIEAAGEEFYVRIARSIPGNAPGTVEAKTLLMRNGREERGHARRLLKAIAAEGATFDLPVHSDNPFVASLPPEIPATAGFLKGLESGEQEGDRQYQAWADAATNPVVARILRQNGREETRHGRRDAQVVRLLAAQG